MKFKRILSMLLMLSIIIIVSACSFLSVSSDKVDHIVYDYLNNKYPDLEFEIKSHTQDTYTSGRYVYDIFCKTTGVDFTLYHSSFLTTDSYSVVYANASAEKSLREPFGEEFGSLYIEKIQWVNFYADGSDGYRFRDMTTQKLPDSIKDIKEIYSFVLKTNSFETTAEAAKILKETISEFYDAGVVLETITFQFYLTKDSVLLTTDTETILNATEETLEQLLTHIADAQVTDEIVEVVPSSGIKKAEYFLKDQKDLSVTESDKNVKSTETENISQ